uniref:Uncharacterized protein n=1 Tax=Anguilla anguilla TaxID=7936 RepID=A0A0E9XUR6_ANGAN
MRSEKNPVAANHGSLCYKRLFSSQ